MKTLRTMLFHHCHEGARPSRCLRWVARALLALSLGACWGGRVLADDLEFHNLRGQTENPQVVLTDGSSFSYTRASKDSPTSGVYRGLLPRSRFPDIATVGNQQVFQVIGNQVWLAMDVVRFHYPGGRLVPGTARVETINGDGKWRKCPAVNGAPDSFNTSSAHLERVRINGREYSIAGKRTTTYCDIVDLGEAVRVSHGGGSGTGAPWILVFLVVACAGIWLWKRRGTNPAPGKPIMVPVVPRRNLQDWREGYAAQGNMREGGFGNAFTVRPKDGRYAGELVVKELQGSWVGGRWQNNAVWVRQMEWECDILDSLANRGYRHAPRVVERGGLLAGTGGTAWYVMSKAQGIPLKDWISGLPAPNGRPGDLQLRLSAIHALAGAISELHQLGVAHRDLKPENIFLLDERRRGRTDYGICLIDFGSAKSHEQGFEMPAGYSVLSPHHYAPEQKRDFNRSGRAADDYVLGILCHEILLGAKPFAAQQDHAEVDRKQMAQKLSQDGHIAYAVASFIAMNLLNMDPVQRGTAQQMLQVLQSTYPYWRTGG